MTKALEKYSENKFWARVFKVIIAFTLMPAIILRAIVIDLFSHRPNTVSMSE